MEKQLDLNGDDDHLRGKKSRQGSKGGGHDQASTLQLAVFVLVLVNTAKVVEVNVEFLLANHYAVALSDIKVI